MKEKYLLVMVSIYPCMFDCVCVVEMILRGMFLFLFVCLAV